MFRTLCKFVTLLPWAAIILLPLLALYAFPGDDTPTKTLPFWELAKLTFKSLGLAAVVAAVGTVAGYVPGKLLGTSVRYRGLLLTILLAHLVLPQYMLAYAWSVLLSPTGAIGQFTSRSTEWAQLAGTISTALVTCLWCWPLAAIVIAQGFRSLDADVWQSARLDAGGIRRFFQVTLPLMAGPLLLAFGVCLALTLGEYATSTFLPTFTTLGAKLNEVFANTHSPESVARTAWPLVVVALAVALALWRKTIDWSVQPASGVHAERPQLWRWLVLAALSCVSLVAPVGLMIFSLRDLRPFAEFWNLQRDGLTFAHVGYPPEIDFSCPGSMPISATAALLALAVCAATFLVRRRWLAAILYVSIFTAALLPAPVIAVAMLKVCDLLHWPELRNNWPVVAFGLAARLAGILLIVLHVARRQQDRHLSELAAVDGAGKFRTWRFVHLPRHWTLVLGGLGLVWMMGLTEVEATAILLPAGVPNFAKPLLDQMHFLRQQQAIASCLIVIGIYLAVAGIIAVFVLLLRRPALTGRATTPLLLLAILLALPAMEGCSKRSGSGPDVQAVIGKTGRGEGEFIYPRAIDLTADGKIVAVDKTGRVQVLTPQGQCELTIQMPRIELGKPTGVSVGPDGNIYVADTHYNRVMVYDRRGKLLRQWGKFGKGPGEFIYPTDIAFAPDGRIFVSEYGGNDRVSIFDAGGKFLGSFGSPGDGQDQFERPAALCVDAKHSLIYVADSCNHRLAVYNLGGKLQAYIGSAGSGQGQFRYPYSVALMPDGTLLVCEYGNNRLQVLTPDGRCLGMFGTAGRDKGQLAFPWAAAVDAQRRAYIVDSGNDRLQVWKL